MRKRGKLEYVTLDSGSRERFPSGAVRDCRAGKGRYDLISPHGLQRLALLMERGSAKYGDRNWERGIPESRCMDSAFRHMVHYMAGDRDEDHLAAVVFNLFAVMHFQATDGAAENNNSGGLTRGK